MKLIDADKLKKQFDLKSTNPNYRVNMHNIKSIITNAPTIEAIPKDQYEARLRADKMSTFKEFREKLSKWMFRNSESVCGNSMIDTDYLEGYMDELLYELGIYEVEDGNDN